MSRTNERTYHPIIPDEVRSELHEHPEMVQQLLHNRGIKDAESARIFLNPDFDAHLHDPFLLTDMEKAVERVLTAIEKNEKVLIYTDYDCDGIPGGVLLHDFFTEIGFTHFENYIPHRHEEGYGFNVDAAQKFVECGVQLIITVDCGITDNEAVRIAQEGGVDVIVTDHHEPSEILPPAFAVINPKRDDAYPFSGICGTAVAFKLVQGILRVGRDRGSITLKEGYEKWWLDLVGIATIADMVPLTDENRVFAHYGLHVLRKSKRPGIQHLLRKAGGSQRHLTEDDIGFTIAPRINAASRMDDPEDAFHMLRTRDEADAGARVQKLEALNNERKGVVASMTKEAKKRMQQIEEIPAVIVLGNPEWRPSLAGLVANSLAEEFNRPTFIWGRDGKGIIKGSCRSEGETSVVRLMEGARGAFIAFGGHHASGGFSVEHADIHTLSDALVEAQTVLGNEAKSSDTNRMVDAVITLSDITESLVRTLDSLGPFGMDNPKPLFEITGVVPREVQVFGKTKNHTKLRLTANGNYLDAIKFFALPEDFTITPQKEVSHTLLAYIERSFFMGRLETRLRIVDIVS